jgi:hypothetical protein
VGFAALTCVLKRGNLFGDAGACSLGETLGVNRSLETLNIVSLFSVFFLLLWGPRQGEVQGCDMLNS